MNSYGQRSPYRCYLIPDDLEVDKLSLCKCGRFYELVSRYTQERFCPVSAGIRINWTRFSLDMEPILNINNELSVVARREK